MKEFALMDSKVEMENLSLQMVRFSSKKKFNQRFVIIKVK